MFKIIANHIPYYISYEIINEKGRVVFRHLALWKDVKDMKAQDLIVSMLQDKIDRGVFKS